MNQEFKTPTNKELIIVSLPEDAIKIHQDLPYSVCYLSKGIPKVIIFPSVFNYKIICQIKDLSDGMCLQWGYKYSFSYTAKEQFKAELQSKGITYNENSLIILKK